MKHPAVELLVDGIVAMASPSEIYMYSSKHNFKGELTSFKLCLVVSDEFDKIKLEADIYMDLECEIPFDILIYHDSEFDELYHQTGSFANKVYEGGELLYEQA